MKINSSASAINWEKTYQINGASFNIEGFTESFSNGYMIAGKNCLVEVDSSGNAIQNKTWNTTDFSLDGIARTSDGYIILADVHNDGLKAIKLNTSGTQVWACQYDNSVGTLSLGGNSSKQITSNPDVENNAWALKLNSSGSPVKCSCCLTILP